MPAKTICLWVIQRESGKVHEDLEKVPLIEETLEKYGFVDPELESDSPFSFSSNIFMEIYGREASTGEIGCSLAHLEAYRMFIKSPYDLMLVAEDDIVVHDHSLLVQNLRNTLSLGSNFVAGLETRDSNRTVKKTSFSKRRKLPFFGTSMYVIDKMAAERVLSGLIDGYLFFWQADFPPNLAKSTKFFVANDWSVTSISKNTGNMRPHQAVRPRPYLFLKRLTNTLLLARLGPMEKYAILVAVHFRELMNAARKVKRANPS